jgi:AbrB family looped-hinge helix DNA binding protein
MVGRIVVDKAGRLVLPKPVRDELQLAPGDALELESSEEQIVLRPVRGTMPLRRKHGIWVFRSGEPLSSETVERAIGELRRDRDQSNTRQKRDRNDR